MASEKRPGGLTALAVINFILGGLSLLGALALAVLLPFLGRAMEQAAEQMPPEQVEQMRALTEMGTPLFIALLIGSFVTAVLLIVSGIGYLKLKSFMGRTLGNVYAIISILSSAGTALWMPVQVGGGFNLSAIIGLIYPVLTLILLNTTFKEDFVN
ncbi:MAG: hypothetical protein ACWGPN_11470 [Gammaproteobacteria bacterium]